MFQPEDSETGRRYKTFLTGCLQAFFLEKFQRYFTKMAKLWYKIIMEVKQRY